MRHFHRQAIDNRNADNNEQIGHLSDLYRFRPVAYHAENSEKSQGKPDLHGNTLQKEEQQKYRHTEQHKREIIVFSTTFSVIKKLYDYPTYEQVECKPQEQHPKVAGIEYIDAHKRKSFTG
jgi:hypothetical protein